MTDAVGDGDWLTLTGGPLSYATALEWVGGPGWGAVTGFAGLVRDHAEERTGVTAIDYEAYEEHVVPRFRELAASARKRWPELGKIVIWHRVGRVATGEASVVIAVSSPHRGEAFDACRYLIDTLKATVPIWKREHWPGGAEWSPAAHGLEPVAPPRGADS
ncbi:MAG TPA: molybdenum cofactor biosynthesis protein MoaE [Acidimicrobiales bacterium]|nr:molybdenum cofactor biosynthesis protein MoaE [Acidimicrobiales bacterium]